MTDIMKKECTKCGLIKSVDDFARRKQSKDGLYYWCRQCAKEYQAERRKRKIAIPEYKVCDGTINGFEGCGKRLPNDQFAINKGNADGLRSLCKECSNERERIEWANRGVIGNIDGE
jgi:hypothetical protein